MNSLIPLLGMFCLLAVAIAVSRQRRRINWRTVIVAFLTQIALGALVLYVPMGKVMLASMSETVASVLGYAQDGIRFVFGDIGHMKIGFIFAFHVLPVVIFFSALVAVLYHWGIMVWIIRIIGGALQKLLGTSRPESMVAAANIFIGQAEAPLTIKPYIPSLSRSQLFAVMVGGTATVAGSVLAGYVGLGVELKYLLAASFMAAPGGLLMAKILEPETEPPRPEHESGNIYKESYVNVIDAAASGTSQGLALAANIGAMLIAFIALIAMFNGILGALGGWLGFEQLSLEWLLGQGFQIVAVLMGIPWDEATEAGSLIGQKLVFNEFIAYANFIEIRETLSPYSQAVITFALCGFANFASIGILLGGFGTIAPERRQDVAKLGLKAVLGGFMANLMSACIAGFFLSFTL
ncbi:MAG: NupC/NupG family nucleoside CNT transporter [Cellvibrionaceae bacterium]|nr:NupC/NupG family nucleoside CNT transporter [Cellvibrionaceae bacterium]MCV6625418.1 NupC/NupG family nucleoside CNT transporter [Cellvibrionaceae bacterium]